MEENEAPGSGGMVGRFVGEGRVGGGAGLFVEETGQREAAEAAGRAFEEVAAI